MGSIYKPKDKKHWYISFIDPDTGKPKNRSTGLLAIPQNRKKANQILQEVEEVITDKKNLYKNNNINRATIGGAFESFLILNKKKHPKTIEDYKRFINLFSISFDLNSPCTVINKLSAESWISNLEDMERSINTIYNYFKVFNKFLNFLFEYNYVPLFKINSQLKPKPEVKDIIVFKEGDLKVLISELNTKNSNFRTVMLLMIYTGLRPSDIYKVEVKDLDFDNMMMKYYSQKIKEHKSVPLHEDLRIILKDRVDEVKTGQIFNYATYAEIGKAFRRYLKKLNLLNKGYTLRTFRKHFATMAYEADVNIVSTSKLIGHKNISTTLKYYTNAKQKKLSDDVNKIKVPSI
ncbi:MAG: site-specific integrase [Ignavibacteriae bacterium]|nr:site-specific integrase [Ignavibacteriota bacterium]